MSSRNGEGSLWPPWDEDEGTQPSSFTDADERTVVVVEDNPDSRQLLVQALKNEGHQVVVAPDGESGMAVLMTRRPKAVILDIGLPGMDGYTLARRTRDAYGDDVTLIAVTGYNQASDRQRALESGFNAHLTKPLDVALLREILHRKNLPIPAKAK